MQNKKRNAWIPSSIPFFAFGVFFYLVSPFLALAFITDSRLIDAALRFIDISYFNIYYWLDVIVISVSWLLGYVCALMITRTKGRLLNSVSVYRLTPSVIFVLLFVATLFLIVRAALRGAVLFSGYATYDISILGPFTTMIFTAAFFINYFSIAKYKKLFFGLFLINSIIVLGFGSRMFFVLGFITILLGFLSDHRKYLKSVSLYSAIGLAFLAMLAIGVWRSGDVEFSFEELFGILLAEPLFTATSGALYLEGMGGRPATNWPIDIFASLINFIPSILLPDKLSLINRLTEFQYKFSPFGASSIIANIYSNFGYFYPLFLFLIGWFYGFLRIKAKNSLFFRAVYFTILPLLMFHFFRDGYITVIKVMFFNGFILPLTILLLLQVMLRRF